MEHSTTVASVPRPLISLSGIPDKPSLSTDIIETGHESTEQTEEVAIVTENLGEHVAPVDRDNWSISGEMGLRRTESVSELTEE